MKLVEFLGVTSSAGYKPKAYYAVVGIVLVTLGAIVFIFQPESFWVSLVLLVVAAFMFLLAVRAARRNGA